MDGSGRAVLLRRSLVQAGIIRFHIWTSLRFQGWAFWARMRWGTANRNDDTMEGCLVVFPERAEKWHDGGWVWRYYYGTIGIGVCRKWSGSRSNFRPSDLDLLSLRLSLLAQLGRRPVTVLFGERARPIRAVCRSGPERGAMAVEREDIRPRALLREEILRGLSQGTMIRDSRPKTALRAYGRGFGGCCYCCCCRCCSYAVQLKGQYAVCHRRKNSQ